MSNEIEKLEVAEGALIPAFQSKYDDTDFQGVASGGKWLPRVQLFGSNSDAAKMGLIPIGTYGLVNGKNLIPLGNEVDVLVVAWRPKAMEIGDGEVTSAFNPKSALFKDLVAKSDEADSGCMFGPEFLVYLPGQKQFATFFMGNKSARREAPAVKSCIGKAATLKVTLASNKKYKWHTSVCVACSTPFDLPAIDEIKEKANEFCNPPDAASEVPDVPVEGDDSDRAR